MALLLFFRALLTLVRWLNWVELGRDVAMPTSTQNAIITTAMTTTAMIMTMTLRYCIVCLLCFAVSDVCRHDVCVVCCTASDVVGCLGCVGGKSVLLSCRAGASDASMLVVGCLGCFVKKRP